MGVLIIAAFFQMAGVACAVVAWRCFSMGDRGGDLGQAYAKAVGVFAIGIGLMMTAAAWVIAMAGRL